MSLNKVINCIKKNKRFLISSHVNLEADALGSELAFYRLLKALGKEAVIVNEDDIPYGHEFFPQVESVKKYDHRSGEIEFDVFVAVDCSDLHRTGEVHRLSAGKPILNIDHHISNQYFGAINWVEDAASCTQMIYKLYKKLKVPIDKDSALVLYAGIMTDTGSFKYTNTTALTFKIVSDLVSKGVNPAEVYNRLYQNVPYDDLKVLASILPGMKRIEGGRVVWFQIKHNLLKHRKLNFDLSESVLSFGRSVKGVDVVVLFKENLGPGKEVRVNFRSHGKIDVNAIAKSFGGGGHKAASGCTIKGKIETVRKRVLQKVRENLL
ncbi:MAG: bifunctional oligoribonuclease/PAP phosphatase NrnA [Candidatus Omnitrophota bacterium]